MASATHTLEADLRAAREAAEVTIEDIHQETRLAEDIIERFEAGKLIGDPSFNIIYLKAFLRSYADAVGVPPHRVEAALEAAKTGAYHGELHPDYVEANTETSAEPSEEKTDDAETEQDDTGAETGAQKETPFPKVDALPPAVPAGSAAFSGTSTAPYAGARPTRRLQQKVRTSSGRTFDMAWRAILGVTVLVVLAVLAVLWLLFGGDSPEPDVAGSDTPESEEVAAGDGPATDGSSPQSPAPRLSFPIEVSVVAGGDGLQSFLVTEAPNARYPVWIEPGETNSFSSNLGVVLWGEGGLGMNPEEVTLRFQGYEWRPPQGQVLRIDSTYGQTLLDSLHAAFSRGGRVAPQS